MRRFSFLIAFLLVTVLSIAFAVPSQAQCGGSTSECTDCCASYCDFGRYSTAAQDCAGARGGERKECLAVANALAHCCFTDCTEAACGTIGQESAVCEAIDEACMD